MKEEAESEKQPEDEGKEYVPHVGTLGLFERYCGISDQQEIITRAKRIREKALQAFPYPCIREFYFMDTRVARHPFYKELLARDDRTRKVIFNSICSKLEKIYRDRYLMSVVVWGQISE